MKLSYFYNNKSLDKFLVNLIQLCLQKFSSIDDNWIKNKDDGTPVTKLDLSLDKLIVEALSSLKYKIPIISEEREFSDDIFKHEIYWLIDPLDGTSSYINGYTEYTVNIALIHKNVPVIGLIAHPPTKKIWYANHNSLTIFNDNLKKNRNCINKTDNNFSIITSKEKQKILTDYLKLFKKSKIIRASSSLKFCKLAENEVKLYPRFSRISKWDIAAGHAILNAAGGGVLGLDKKKLVYNSMGSKITPFFAISNMKYKEIIFSNYNKLVKNSF